MRRMGGSDAYFLDAETPRAYMHTFKIAIVDPGEHGWSFDAYRERLRRRLDRLPVFRWRYLPSPLGLSYPVWVDDPDFNLDYHIRRVGCPAPGDQRALCEFMSAAYAYQLDRSRPLWTTWVVEGLQGGKVALVTLIHHAYFDGAGASNAMKSFFDPAPVGQEDPEPLPWNPPPLPGWTARLLQGAASLPGVLVRGLPPAISGLRKKRAVERAARAAGLPPHPAPELMPPTPLNRTLGHGRTLVCESLPLERLQQARQGQQFTINDVFLSCCAGALRRLLQEMGHAPVQPLVAGVPISNAREKGKELYGNFASVDYCWLHIEIADPLERLRASQASAMRMKEHIAASQGADIGALMRLAPPWITRLLAWSIRRREGRYGLFGNVVASNVVGPRTPLYFGEMKIDNWFSTGQVFEGSSLNITLWSYCDKANLSILGDSKVLPDGWRLFGYFCAELDALAALAPGRGEGRAPLPQT